MRAKKTDNQVRVLQQIFRQAFLVFGGKDACCGLMLSEGSSDLGLE